MSVESNPAKASSRAHVEPRVPAAYSISDPPVETAKPAAAAAIEEEAEVLHASIKAGSVAQIVVAVIAVVGLIYLLKLVMVTTLAAMLLAFILEPLVSGLNKLRLPRPAGALFAVVLTLALAGALSYFFYQRAIDFATEFPKYSGKIRATLAKVRTETKKIEDSTRSVIAAPKDGQKAVAVEVQEAPALSRVVSQGSEVLLAIGFIPFLVFFMLTWKDHARDATVQLFTPEHRAKAHRTVGKISSMIRSFIVGNAVVGLFERGGQHPGFLVAGHSVFLFCRRNQRLCEPGALSGSVSGAIAAIDGGSWKCEDNWSCHYFCHGGGIAYFDYECVVSKNCGQAIAFESAGSDVGAFILGLDLGSDGIDIGGADCGSDQNHL